MSNLFLSVSAPKMLLIAGNFSTLLFNPLLLVCLPIIWNHSTGLWMKVQLNVCMETTAYTRVNCVVSIHYMISFSRLTQFIYHSQPITSVDDIEWSYSRRVEYVLCWYIHYMISHCRLGIVHLSFKPAVDDIEWLYSRRVDCVLCRYIHFMISHCRLGMYIYHLNPQWLMCWSLHGIILHAGIVHLSFKSTVIDVLIYSSLHDIILHAGIVHLSFKSTVIDVLITTWYHIAGWNSLLF